MQTCAKLKRELQLSRRRGGTKLATRAVDTTADESIMSTGQGNLSTNKLSELTDKLRHRLINAEKQLGKLREENR